MKKVIYVLTIHDSRNPSLTVDGRIFDEDESSDYILHIMEQLEDFGFSCSLTCEVWSVPANS